MIAAVQSMVFFFLAAIVVASALAAVTRKNLFHSALFFGLFLLGIAGIYLVLAADFVAITQIFVYVGGVVVLISFAVMLTSRIAEASQQQISEQREASLVAATILLGVMLLVLNQAFSSAKTAVPKEIGVALIGKALLTSYALPFEMVALLLLVAMVAAILMAREDTP